MTIEEAIESLSLLRIFDAPSLNEAVKMAVIALRTQAGMPPNDPLTPEQMREMDGEPVWNDTIKKYALVDAGWWDGIGRAINSNGKYRLLDDRYYRRKPEEGGL